MASFNIKSAISQIHQTEPQKTWHKAQEVKVENITARTPVTVENLNRALEQYIKANKPDQMVAFALKTHKPQIDGDHITLLIDNQLQIEKLEEIHHFFYAAMTKLLNNGAIVIDYKLFNPETTKEVKRYYTSSEKFQHFVELNPVVAELKEVFGLELE